MDGTFSDIQIDRWGSAFVGHVSRGPVSGSDVSASLKKVVGTATLIVPVVVSTTPAVSLNPCHIMFPPPLPPVVPRSHS